MQKIPKNVDRGDCMPLARRRLDCCICIKEQTDEAVLALRDIFGLIQSGHDQAVPCGGFHSCSFEQSEKLRLYANHQGGYRVRCPFCAHNIASEFSKSVHLWRSGAVFSMTCPSCAQVYSLSKAKGIPPFAFSRAAIVLHDVEVADIGAFWCAQLMERLGGYHAIFRRVG